MGRGVPGQRHGMRRRTARGWRTTRWTIDRSGSRTGARCWTEPARTRERAPVSAATEPDAAFRNDAGGYFLPADASSPAFGRKRSRAVSKIIRCVRNSRARLSSRWPRSSSRPACPRRLGQASRSLRSISTGPRFGTGRGALVQHATTLGADRKCPPGRVRDELLSVAGRLARDGETQLKQSPEKPRAVQSVSAGRPETNQVRCAWMNI